MSWDFSQGNYKKRRKGKNPPVEKVMLLLEMEALNPSTESQHHHSIIAPPRQ